MDIKSILSSKNLAESLEDNQSARIAQDVLERFNKDIDSRSEKQQVLEELVKLSMSVMEEKSYPWAGASNINFPLISTASVDFAAKCSPEILRDDFIVKAKVIGNDAGKIMFNNAGEKMFNEDGSPVLKDVGAKQERGERVSTYMNYQLTEEIENWTEDTDRMLVSLPVVGTMFKKTYKNGDHTINSELIFPDKLIVHDQTTRFDRAPITHIQELYPNEIQERIRKGFFKEFIYDIDSSDTIGTVNNVDLSEAQNGNVNDANSGLHVFLEQCCYLDLDEDGFLEPYTATIHKKTDSLVRLVPRFEESNIKKEGNKIVEIKAYNPYTVYKFIPSIDGSFYGIGLGHLLYNLNKGVNSSINQLTDAATLQNTGGGFIAKSLKIRGGSFKMRPNEYHQVDSYGSALRDSIFTMPTPQPSQTLFALLGFLTQSGKELGSLRDSLTGENAANVQATTMMALVEQGITQFRSIYKRIYRSLKSEFKIIYTINSKNLTNKKYAEVLDEPVSEVDVKADFSKRGFDITPVADGASLTNSQRMAKANFLMGFIGDPFTNQMLLRQRIFSDFAIEDYKDLITPPPPEQPSVELTLAQAEIAKAENRMKEVQIKAIETSANIEKAKYDNEKTLAEIKEIETQALKNISEAFRSERESVINTANAVRQQIEQRVEDQTLTSPVENTNNQV